MATHVNIPKLLAKVCKHSFWRFCQEFWEEIPGSGILIPNWHMEYLCSELQEIAERVFRNEPKKHDLLVNISPGSSKSSLASILFPAWIWTRDPSMRMITASHTDDLVLDLANKSRTVIKSDLYQSCFPEVQIRDDQDTKGYYATTRGGDRKTCTIAGKSPTGFHGNFIICFPYETKITTQFGPIEIGKIVEERLPVSVLSYNHSFDKLEWRPIVRYDKNPGKELLKVTLENGTTLSLTEEHPVYVMSRGYVPANSLRVNDKVMYADTMHIMRTIGLSNSITCKKVQEWMDLLQSLVSCSIYEREKSSCLQFCKKIVSALWEETFSKEVESRKKQLLLSKLLSYTQQRKRFKKRKPLSKVLSSMFLLFFGYRTIKAHNHHLLLKKVCRSTTFKKDGREGKFKLYAWNGECWVSSNIHYAKKKVHQEKRKVSLLSVSETSERIWKKIRCTSYRLRQKQQQKDKFSSFMSFLSFWVSWWTENQIEKSEKRIISIEREIRIPGTVYNLEVAENHNYFAEEILVHNCDDPIDPKRAVSEVELKIANAFYDTVVPSRKVNKEVSVEITIMQRLHVDDPTGHLLERAKRENTAKIRHVCLPAELFEESNKYMSVGVSPPELTERYQDGLMDPIRLSRNVLQRERATMGAYAYAGQYLQNPIPMSGGMFAEHYFNQRVKAAPYNAKRIRYWDRACLLGSGLSLITTKRGLVPIEKVTEKDEVLTRKGWKNVLFSGETKQVSSVTLVLFSNGSVVAGTEDHLVWVENEKKWKPLAELDYFSNVIGENCEKCIPLYSLTLSKDKQVCVSHTCFTKEIDTTILSIYFDCAKNIMTLLKDNDVLPVYDLTIQDEPEFFVNDILVHNSSTAVGACYTAGVLMAKDAESNFYIEDVIHGQWEPNERNQRMRAAALKDRNRYGKYEPVIWVEAEGGSSGRDAWKAVARALAGFNVKEDRVSGSKETRAEPWAAQLAAGNVYVVDNGTWDIPHYIAEHCAFPLGKIKDLVDSSTGAFNLLVNMKVAVGSLRVYTFKKTPDKNVPQIIVTNKEEMESLLLENHHRCLLVVITDPEPVGRPGDMPMHAIAHILAHTTLQFTDHNPENYQENWNDLIAPYDRSVEDLMMYPAHGKSLWSFLRKQRQEIPNVLLFCDMQGKRRAVSIAYAVADVMRWDRSCVSFSDNEDHSEEILPHIYDVMKAARSSVL